MKRSTILILTLAVMTMFVYSEVKIGVINAQKVIMGTARGKAIQKKLKAIGASKQQKVQQMQNEIKKLEKELQSPALNSDARDRKADQLQSRKTKFKRYVEDTQKELRRRYQKEIQTLQKEVMPIIDRIGKSKGFTIIFDLSIAGISYFDKTIDITDLVIKEIDKKPVK